MLDLLSAYLAEDGIPLATMVIVFGSMFAASKMSAVMSGGQVMFAVFYVMLITAGCFALGLAITGMG